MLSYSTGTRFQSQCFCMRMAAGCTPECLQLLDSLIMLPCVRAAGCATRWSACWPTTARWRSSWPWRARWTTTGWRRALAPLLDNPNPKITLILKPWGPCGLALCLVATGRVVLSGQRFRPGSRAPRTSACHLMEWSILMCALLPAMKGMVAAPQSSCARHERNCMRECCDACGRRQLTIRRSRCAGGPGAAQQLQAARARAHGGRMTRGHFCAGSPLTLRRRFCPSAIRVGCMAGVV